MRIANVIEEARIGGPQKRIVEVGRKLLKNGIETIIITTSENSENLVRISQNAALSVETVNVVRLRLKLTVIIHYMLFFLPDIFCYLKLYKRLNPDMVHTNGASQWKPAIAAKLAGVPVIWHLNDTRCPLFILWPFKLFSMFCADAFIVSSSRTQEVYLNRKESRPVLLARPPVSNERFSPFRKKHLSDPHVVLTVGNLNPDKDILTFIRLSQLAYEEFGTEILFRVLGRRLNTQKEYNFQIDSQLEKRPHNIEFLGFVDNVPQHLQKSDIFVCTSRSEAGPMSVFEAFAAGVPVVTTDVGDIKEITEEHGSIALIANVGDEIALYKQLKRLLEPSLNEKIGQQGKEYCAMFLDVSQCARSHEEAYRSIKKQ